MFIAIILRFYNYANWSFSNDELSELLRLKFDNLKDLINYGIKPDVHPAGLEIFLYYWVKLFGNSEASIRFPFIISGIISVLISCLIGNKWFNKTTGIMSALVMSFLQYTIIYSQVARPYSFGLLFSLSAVWFWTNLIFNKQKDNIKLFIFYYSLFILSIVFAAYIHYFCALFVLIVYITGLFFINKNNYKLYIISAFIAMILYLPHVKIFLFQFSKEGIGGPQGWLGIPGNNWLWEYLFYCFNNSILLVSTIISVSLFGAILNYKNIKYNKYHLICLLWFFLPFFIGFFYSRLINPVLQYSVLLFSFPFLLFFLFSFLPSKLNTLTLIFVFIIGTTGIYDTVFSQKHYTVNHFANFKGIAKDFYDWNKKHNNDITNIININNPYYINYYLNKYNAEIEFKQNINLGGKDIADLKLIVDSCKSQYFAFAWLRPSPSEIPDIIKSKFPYLIVHNNYNDLSEDYLFSKIDISYSSDAKHVISNKPEITIFNGFESKKDLWGKDSSLLEKNKIKDGIYSLQLNKSTEFSPTYDHLLSEITKKPVKKIEISIYAYTPDSPENLNLVISIESKNKNNKIWATSEFKHYAEAGKWYPVFLNYTFTKSPSVNDRIKIYVWNSKAGLVYLDDFKISFFTDN